MPNILLLESGGLISNGRVRLLDGSAGPPASFRSQFASAAAAKGISQEDLAHRAGINRSYMNKLEKGASYPGLEIIAKLAMVLEAEPAELLRVRSRIECD